MPLNEATLAASWQSFDFIKSAHATGRWRLADDGDDDDDDEDQDANDVIVCQNGGLSVRWRGASLVSQNIQCTLEIRDFTIQSINH